MHKTVKVTIPKPPKKKKPEGYFDLDTMKWVEPDEQ